MSVHQYLHYHHSNPPLPSPSLIHVLSLIQRSPSQLSLSYLDLEKINIYNSGFPSTAYH